MPPPSRRSFGGAGGGGQPIKKKVAQRRQKKNVVESLDRKGQRKILPALQLHQAMSCQQVLAVEPELVSEEASLQARLASTKALHAQWKSEDYVGVEGG